MDMNKKLTTTGIFRPGQLPQLFPEFDAHLNRMQSLAFRIGDQLVEQPAGTVAIISNEMQVGVVPFRGKIETVMVEHYTPDQPDDDVQWFCFTKQVYQECDWGGEEQIDEISEQLEAWLLNPVFGQLNPTSRIQHLVQGLEKWIDDYESSRAPN
ncbi:hypothetical protein [Pseudomonas mosselii]|uniref:hypothetical protein n=1 Tax=Pseudomonas mosselii TaxID=78327 RepID=UPI0021D7E8B0|nr:hypothetical protein [Pseudomonas mosselii]MCU9529382.1 hypothetical protein [Pseudomonas mosselii]MCU9536673.1 hypothetical protein [Pseudomonas mosselii]MCU9542294.1 hypothetical protein [Pseudomonas mosselii]MCU9548398.1 hypothetical protein [Pseudomonas mosselii]